jgi:hypothetical protein
MRNKLYFVAPAADQAAIAATCSTGPREWHFHSIPPDHGKLLVVVIRPTPAMETEFTSKYLAFPELHDPSEHLSQAVVDAFPASVGLSTADSTFSALKKIHAAHGMAGMHPKS